MGMDFNKTFITGRVYGMGLSPMKNNGLYVAEGKLCVNNAMNAKGEVLRDDFPIRCYGKQAEFFGKLKDGTYGQSSGLADRKPNPELELR